MTPQKRAAAIVAYMKETPNWHEGEPARQIERMITQAILADRATRNDESQPSVIATFTGRFEPDEGSRLVSIDYRCLHGNTHTITADSIDGLQAKMSHVTCECGRN